MTDTSTSSEPLVIVNSNPWNNGVEEARYSDGYVTFYSYSYVLYEREKYGFFDVKDEDGELIGPGFYRDSEVWGNGSENDFTVILDWNGSLIEDLVNNAVKQLNKEFGTDFHEKVITVSDLRIYRRLYCRQSSIPEFELK